MKRILIGLGLALVLAMAVAACGGDDEAEQADIVETAVEAGSFTTLASLLESAGLVETLKGEGPFTVFAPTDDAFAALPAGTLEALGMPENAEQLEAVLLYHVASGEVGSGDLSDGQVIETLQGSGLAVDINEGSVQVGNAIVSQPDVEASNGVIHVVDSVLIPQS